MFNKSRCVYRKNVELEVIWINFRGVRKCEFRKSQHGRRGLSRIILVVENS